MYTVVIRSEKKQYTKNKDPVETYVTELDETELAEIRNGAVSRLDRDDELHKRHLLRAHQIHFRQIVDVVHFPSTGTTKLRSNHSPLPIRSKRFDRDHATVKFLQISFSWRRVAIHLVRVKEELYGSVVCRNCHGRRNPVAFFRFCEEKCTLEEGKITNYCSR